MWFMGDIKDFYSQKQENIPQANIARLIRAVARPACRGRASEWQDHAVVCA
jgi:histone H3/H4